MKRKKIYGIFMLVAIAVFLFAGERILQIYLNYQESQKVYEQMEGFTQKIEDQDLSPEAVPGETPEEVAEQGFLQVDFNKLEEINPDVIAWIEIPGLEISYLEKQQKILFAEENLEDKEITDIDISLEERLELEKKEQLLLDESKGIYPEWNEMTDINLMEAMFSLQEEERKLIYQHVFEERTFKEMSILNQMPEERCKGAYYWAIRKIRKRMGGKRS